eukprot:m.45369 g.45369  ORF g.45369 m.45369 type:complete len:632 (-) comp6243_c0_seq2:73-1968(-)
MSRAAAFRYAAQASELDSDAFEAMKMLGEALDSSCLDRSSPVGTALVNDGAVGAVCNALRLAHESGQRDMRHWLMALLANLSYIQSDAVADDMCKLVASPGFYSFSSESDVEFERLLMLGILNLCCWATGGREKLLQRNIDHLVLPLFESKDDTRASFIAGIITSILVGNNENNPLQLASNASIFKKVANVLRSALDDDPEASYEEISWSAVSPTMCLSILGIADANIPNIIESGALPLIKQLLDRTKRTRLDTDGEFTRSRIFATKCLWHIEFSRSIEELVPGIRSTLENLERQSALDPRLRDVIQRVLFQMRQRVAQAQAAAEAQKEEEEVSSEAAEPPASKGHVMLSYQWDYQPLFIWLRDELRKAGYNVWIDVDQMKASTLDAMASAIENAAVVIVCLASKYKESASCQTEGNYAYQRRKRIIPVRAETNYRPDGWLGALIGSKLYYDMTDEASRPAKLAELIRELGDVGRVSEAGKQQQSLSEPPVMQQQQPQQHSSAAIAPMSAPVAVPAPASALDSEMKQFVRAAGCPESVEPILVEVCVCHVLFLVAVGWVVFRLLILCPTEWTDLAQGNCALLAKRADLARHQTWPRQAPAHTCQELVQEKQELRRVLTCWEAALGFAPTRV